MIGTFDRLAANVRKKYNTKSIDFTKSIVRIKKDCELNLANQLRKNQTTQNIVDEIMELLEVEATTNSITLKIGDIQTRLNF